MISTQALPQLPSIVLAMPQSAAAPIAQEIRAIGCSVVVASSVADTAGCLAKLTGRLIVLAELSFPDGNWRDLMERTQAQHSGIRFVLCTAARTTELWWDALDCGVSDIVTPPYSVSDLTGLMLP
jgi:DNA-binding NtrC family response regulator